MTESQSDPSTAEDAQLVRTILAKVPAMLAYWGPDERCRFANAAFERLVGLTPDAVVGRTAEEVLGPLYALNEPYIKEALRGREQLFEREIVNRATGASITGQIHYVPDIVDGQVRGFCTLVADTTARVRAEEALRRTERELQDSERWRALATLAGGVAHEINNPLAVVLGNLDLALNAFGDWSMDGPALRTALTEIRKSATRVRDIVQSMGIIAGTRPTKRQPVDVDDTLAKSIDLTSNAIRYRARIVRNLGGSGYVDGSATELAQVFIHLLVNAADSLPTQRDSNEIRLETRREGDRVVIEVGDNGGGIPEAIQPHVFEPFFTGKGVGGHPGLGLAVSRGLVASMGGTLELASTGPTGTVFRVTLPQGSSERPPVHRPTRSSAPAPAMRPRFLVVDDEPNITKLLSRVFDKSYDVITLNLGRQAVDVLCEQGSHFDMILCDLMMPGTDGSDLYAEVTAQRPDYAGRFIFMTGGAFTAKSRDFLEASRAPVIAKPFDLLEIQRMVAVHWNQMQAP
jgi:two-component system, NtrC family, sensor kinase